MGRYDDYYNYYPPSLTKAELNARAQGMAAKLAKKLGHPLQPVCIEGTKIAKTFWGKAWCDNIGTYQDNENRLPRGRSYVRSGSVIDLAVDPGYIAAWVAGSGSKPYEVEIKVAPLNNEQKERIRNACTAQPLSMLDLLQGKLPAPVLEMFRSGPDGIFPRLNELKLYCSCPDSSSLCKHLAAVLYGVGHRLDEKPELLFTLRGLDINSLVETSAGNAQAALTAPPETELGDADLSAVFGIDLAPADTMPSPTLARPEKPDKPLPPMTYSAGDCDTRPWGSWLVMDSMPRSVVKKLTILPGQRLSLQSHRHRSELWTVVEGIAAVQCDDNHYKLHPGEQVFLPKGCRHRLANTSEAPVTVIEIQFGNILSEEDIERYSDDYGRGTEWRA